MALIDDPKAWILRLFEMEEREGRGADCQRFPAGAKPNGVPLDAGEEVYGIYKNKYFFTAYSFITRTANGYQRIRWDTIVNCSSQHGEGKKRAELTLTDGSAVTVRVGDFATGWSGRISQLFHQMIQKWGAQATLGPEPLSIEDFFAAATDEYCLAPNLEPHPSLEELRSALTALRDRDDVRDVLVRVVEIEDAVPTADAAIIRTPCMDLDLSDFIMEYHADGVIDASEEVVRFFPEGALYTKMIVWD